MLLIRALTKVPLFPQRGFFVEVRSGRCEVGGARCEVRGYLFDFAVLELAVRIAVNSFASLNKSLHFS